MQALELHEAELCGGCGGLRAETTSPAHDFDNPMSVLVYDAAPGSPAQCHRCAAIDRVQRDTETRNPKHPTAMLHAVQLGPRAPMTLPGGML